MSYLVEVTLGKDSTILDFFSGSATTAHAIMKLNAEDGGNRKFIMVQLPELTDERVKHTKPDIRTLRDRQGTYSPCGKENQGRKQRQGRHRKT